MRDMNDSGFLLVCMAGILTVFFLLAVLAAVFRVITLVFPARRSGSDAALLAAVAAVVQRAYPGTRVSRVEEDKK